MCSSCRSAHRSYGIQSTECMPCNAMTFNAASEYQEAVAFDMCDKGLMTSYLLIFFITIFVCGGGGLMCHTESKNGEKDDLKPPEIG